MKEEINLDYLKNLISSSNHASARSRTNYFILCLSCVFVLIGVFNMEWSWERHINFDERGSLGFNHNLYPKDTAAQHILESKKNYDSVSSKSKLIYEKYIDNMSDNFTGELFKRFEVNIPVLGIRIFSSDLAAIASLGILIVFTWLFFSIRREYHIINRLKLEFNRSGNNKELKKMIYYGAVFENVFTTATKNNIAFKGRTKLAHKIMSPSYVMLLLKLLPVATIALAIFSDVNSLSPYLFETYPIEICIRITLAAASLIYCSYVTRQIYQFDKSIEANLAYMNKKTSLIE